MSLVTIANLLSLPVGCLSALRVELATTGKEALDTLARLDKMKQLTKRSIESTSDKYVQSMFHCSNTSLYTEQNCRTSQGT